MSDATGTQVPTDPLGGCQGNCSDFGYRLDRPNVREVHDQLVGWLSDLNAENVLYLLDYLETYTDCRPVDEWLSDDLSAFIAQHNFPEPGYVGQIARILDTHYEARRLARRMRDYLHSVGIDEHSVTVTSAAGRAAARRAGVMAAV